MVPLANCSIFFQHFQINQNKKKLRGILNLLQEQIHHYLNKHKKQIFENLAKGTFC